jgi:hypothetical protein
VPLKMLGFLLRKAGQTQPEPTKPILLVTLFGISSEAQSEILQVISGKFARRFRIVFCITTDDFSAFLRHGIVCETFPSVENQRHYHDLLDWPSYLNGKWALVIEKWKPTKILAYGMNFERYIDASKAAAQTGGSS